MMLIKTGKSITNLYAFENKFIKRECFRTFSVAKRKARKGRNPKTGETIRIAAKMIPKFKSAWAIKEAVK